MRHLHSALLVILVTLPIAGHSATIAAPAAPTIQLPKASDDPLTIDRDQDPILSLGKASADPVAFRAAIADVVRRNAAGEVAEAGAEEAVAARGEARSRLFPVVDLNVSADRVLSREFSNDPFNIVEQLRRDGRTDATISAQQLLFDFGAASARFKAAGQRLRVASAEIDNANERVALDGIAAWYDLFAYQALVRLSDAFVENQRELGTAIDQRIEQGVAAKSDRALVDAYIASAEARLARFKRQRDNAAARYRDLFDLPVPAQLERAPLVGVQPASEDWVKWAASNSPAVRSAQAGAEASRLDARAVRHDTMPTVSAGVDAGRYGVFETDRDYVVRARVTMRKRFFGGLDARADQAEARAKAASARARMTAEEAERRAAIAWSDARALEDQLKALENSYLASRKSRDVVATRFLVSRGSLLDVLREQDSFFGSAAAYIQSLTELDAARYVLLARTGQLLDTIGIEPGDAMHAANKDR